MPPAKSSTGYWPHPQHHEQDVSLEFHPFRNRAADQRRRDDGEHHLKEHEALLRDGRRVVRIRRGPDAIEHEILEWIPEKRVSLPESQAVAVHHPYRRNHRHQDQALHHGAEDVFAPHQSAIEKNQTRRRHHQHQRGAGEHPGVIAHVDDQIPVDGRLQRAGVRLHRGGAQRISRVEQDGQEPADQKDGKPPPKTNAFHVALEFNPKHPAQVK
jgi:hypothetical protein